MSQSQVETLTSVALFCVIAGILVALLLPANDLGTSDGRLRTMSEARSWIAHGILFAALGLAVGLRLAAPVPSRLTRTALLTAAAAIIGFATASEFAQLAVEGRNATLGDWIADLIGMVLGLGLASAIGPRAIGWVVRARPT